MNNLTRTEDNLTQAQSNQTQCKKKYKKGARRRNKLVRKLKKLRKEHKIEVKKDLKKYQNLKRTEEILRSNLTQSQVNQTVLNEKVQSEIQKKNQILQELERAHTQ